MNYGLSAYTKVLELEKRINNSNGATSIKLYDSGAFVESDFLGEFIVNSDSLLADKNSSLYYKLNFDLLSEADDEIYISYYINDKLVYEKTDTLTNGEKKSFFMDFSYNNNADVLLNGYLKIQSLNSSNNIKISNYRLIVLGATENKSIINSFETELRACKTPNETFIVSYTQDNSVYACEINKDSTNFDFVKIIDAVSHSFAFDKADNLHLFYVDSNNNLYDKVINSVYNDKLISENVAMVYATKASNFNSADIVISFIDNINYNVFYTSIENNNVGTILKPTLPNGKYIDITMVAGEKFVYLAVTNQSNASYILKSAYEPLSGGVFENITASSTFAVSKYYTLEDSVNSIFDTISASLNVTINTFVNYERLISELSCDMLYASINSMVESYQIPKEETVHYTVVIDKAEKNYFNRCVYADDATEFLPVTNTDGVLVMNGWDNRFPFNKIKPCVFRGNKFVDYLDPNDYTKYIDGTPVNSDASDNFVDVMVEIPKIYYAIENIDPYVYVHISNQPLDERFKCLAHVYDGTEVDNIYVSAYHCGYKEYNGKNTFFSFSNTYPNCYDVVDSSNYRTLLENKEAGYRIMNYNQATLLQCLFIIMFKSTGSEKSFARGNNDSQGALFANGYCDKLGLYAGAPKSATPCKMFGIENIYGNCYTKIDEVAILGQYLQEQYVLRLRSPYSNVPINKEGVGYDEYYNSELDGVYNAQFYLNDPYATTELGFLPKSVKYSGSSDTATYIRFYCDASFVSKSYGLWWGGDAKRYTNGGIFHYKSDNGEVENASVYRLGYRLVYYPIGGN